MGLEKIKRPVSEQVKSLEENINFFKAKINQTISVAPGAVKAAAGAISCFYQPLSISFGPTNHCVKGVFDYFKGIQNQVEKIRESIQNRTNPASNQNTADDSKLVCE